jgi:hypothetical protein
MEEKKCAFCGGEINGEPWIGSLTKLPYCPDDRIGDCLSRFASRVEYIDCTYHPVADAA